MPRFGGINVNSFTGALINNAVGSIANAVLPRSVFGGFGAQALDGLVGQQGRNQDPENRRVSLSPKPAAMGRVLGNGLLNPLKETGGLVWPYTPTISYNQEIDYQQIAMVHANQDFHVYSKTPAVQLQVNGDFTVQNQKEGQYALAAIHFLRTVTKMNFGESDPLAGTPPPVLLFNAYGAFVFNNLPVIVKGFQIEFPDSVDYVQVKASGSTTTTTTRTVTSNREVPLNIPAVPTLPQGIVPPHLVFDEYYEEQAAAAAARLAGPRIETITNTVTTEATARSNYIVWLPSAFKISATLIVQHTPKQLRSTFNLPQFRDGGNNQRNFI